MKLYYAAASPFVRKVRMAAHELNLSDKIELVESIVLPGKENADYANRVNPLRKIPALQIDDGSIILDSSVICDYLNDLHGQHQLIPASGLAKWQIQTAHSMANGIMDAAVSIRYETFLRPESHRWPVWIEEQWEKINNALSWFNERDNNGEMTVDNTQYTNLAAWHSNISHQESYKTTEPA